MSIKKKKKKNPLPVDQSGVALLPGQYPSLVSLNCQTVKNQDLVAQTLIKFKSQLNLNCSLISCTFQVSIKF